MQALRFYLTYFLSYLMLSMVAPYHTKMFKCNSLGLALAIDPTSPRGILYTMLPDTTLDKPQR